MGNEALDLQFLLLLEDVYGDGIFFTEKGQNGRNRAVLGGGEDGFVGDEWVGLGIARAFS